MVIRGRWFRLGARCCMARGMTERESRPARLIVGISGASGIAYGVRLLQVLRNIFNLLGLESFYQMTVTGIIIIIAILLNRFIDLRMGGE